MAEEERTQEEAVVETTAEQPTDAPKDAATETAETPEATEAAPTTDSPKEESKNDNGRGGNRGRGRGRGGDNRDNRRGGKRGRRRNNDKPDDGFESKIVDLARVTRVMAGGKRMRFRACVVVGDGKGQIGMGVKKGIDVQQAVQKATDYAKKHLFTVKNVDGTIPHTVEVKFRGAQVLIKPAKEGTGLIAGGPTRVVLEMAGLKNIVAKMKGSSGNKINNVTAVMNALRSLRTREEIEQLKKND